MRRLLVTLILGVSLASAAGYEEALRHASVQMQGLVAAATGWDATDPREAYVLITAIALGRVAEA